MVAVPAVGDQASAAWADAVAAAVNAIVNPAKFDGFNSLAQSIAASTWTAIALNSENYDTVNGHSTTTNNTRYTVQSGYAGVYLVVVQCGFVANATGVRAAGVGINGTGVVSRSEVEYANVGAGATTVIQTSWMSTSLNVGDYIEGLVWQNSGGALNTVGGFAGMQCFFMGT